MRKYDLNDSYIRCEKDGIIRKKDDVDIELIKSLLNSAKANDKSFKSIEKNIDNTSFLFTSKYDVLRKLISAFILFDKIKIDNHLCLNAYICKKHQDLNLDWDILEGFRLRRNSINYEGKELDNNEWKKSKFQFEIYIKTFISSIENKIKEFE
jgi:hypothetical protein